MEGLALDLLRADSAYALIDLDVGEFNFVNHRWPQPYRRNQQREKAMSSQGRPDFSAIPEGAVEELFRQAEACLQGTVQLAIAADQRATTMTGVFGAGSVALLVAAATILAGSSSDRPFLFSALMMALLLFIAALLCAWAARPIDFFIAGYQPRLYAEAAGDSTWMKRCASEDFQTRIDQNRAALVGAARIVQFGAVTAAMSPLVGVGTYFLATYFL